jgi:thiol:disulfide interchange protein DsbA
VEQVMNGVKSITVAATIAITVFSAQIAGAQEQNVGIFSAGRNFTVLPERQATSSPADRVEVAELFAYTCIYCYRLESPLQAWRADEADYVNFVRIPVPFDEWRVLLARAHYTADILGKLGEMHDAFFEEIHEKHNLLQTRDAIRDLFGRFGVSAESFDAAFDSDEVSEKTARARELTIAYQASATPTIVVNGTYVTLQTQAASQAHWFEIIDALVESEAGKLQ